MDPLQVGGTDSPQNGGSVNPVTGQALRRAIWIASYPKSGNTWLRVFLNNLMREVRGEGVRAQNINALHQWSSREALLKDFAPRLGKPAQDATAAEIAAVRPLVQADLVRGHGPPILFKTHNAVASVEGFPTINFEITRAAIYVVRNPLDVVISYAHHMGLSIDATISDMADADNCTQLTDQRRVYEFMSSWSFHVASWISVPHRPVLIVRYEDMLATPERSFGRVASFLSLTPNAEQLRRAIANSSFDQLAEQEATYGFRERPASSDKFFRSGKSGQWKDALSNKQVHAIVQAHAPMMMRCGYLKETMGDDHGSG
jgi:hypothetical protein